MRCAGPPCVEAQHPEQACQPTEMAIQHEARDGLRLGREPLRGSYRGGDSRWKHFNLHALLERRFERRGPSVHDNEVHLRMRHAERLDGVFQRGRTPHLVIEPLVAAFPRQVIVQLAHESETRPRHEQTLTEYRTPGDGQRSWPSSSCSRDSMTPQSSGSKNCQATTRGASSPWWRERKTAPRFPSQYSVTRCRLSSPRRQRAQYSDLGASALSKMSAR